MLLSRESDGLFENVPSYCKYRKMKGPPGWTAFGDGLIAKYLCGIFFEPFGKAGDAVFQIDAGCVSDFLFKGFGVCPSDFHISRLHRKHCLFGFVPKIFFESGNEIHQFDGFSASDIIKAIESFRFFGSIVGNAADSFYNVVDVGEVAHHVAVVEHFNRAVVRNGICKKPRRHIRTSPRPIDGKEAKARQVQVKKMVVGFGHQFVGTLGGGVKAGRFFHAIRGAKRRFGIASIDAGRRGIHKMLGRKRSCAFQNI